MALLAAFGLVMIYRIDDGLARDQADWFVLGLVLFAATIVFLRDYEALERYRYLIAMAGIALLVLPRLPGIGDQINGAYLGDHLGPFTFQPAELAKICIVIFLASYLARSGSSWWSGARRVAGLTLPPLKHLGPLLVVWGAAMLMLVFIRDLGSSLMFFGAFLALLYVATARDLLRDHRHGDVRGRRVVLRPHGRHVQERFDIWLDPFHRRWERRGTRSPSRSSPRLTAVSSGGASASPCSSSRASPRLRQRLPELRRILPAPHTDFIYAVIVNELGLFGGGGGRADLRPDRRARLQDGDAGRRRLLQAARDRADRGVRPAGVRDHRRRHQGDPADRRHAAVHQLRRQLGRRQLHPARAAADDLRQGSRRPGAAARPSARGGSPA